MTNSIINSPLVLPCGLTFKNRLVKAAMTEGLADDYARATDELAVLYDTWSRNSNCGMLITGNIQVDRRFLERPGNVCIDMDFGEQTPEQISRLWKYSSAVTKNGAHIFAQIGHAGRQSTRTVCERAPAPSSVNLKFDIPVPEAVELTVDGIQQIIQKFVYACTICKETGFSGVQLHSAHGYLLSSFLNPLANKRTDNYGGTLENRARMLLDTVKNVRNAVGENFPISVKLNSADFQQGGLTFEDSTQVALWLAETGVDILEISGGNYESAAMMGNEETESNNTRKESTIKREAYFVGFAKDMMESLGKFYRRNKNIPNVKRMVVMVTGGFRSKTVMEEAIKSGACDLIGVARPLCIDTCCTALLLSGKLEALPCPENTTKLPWYVGGSRFEHKWPFSFFKMGGLLMFYYSNIIDLGKGQYNEEEEKKKIPDIIRKMLFMQWQEFKAARSLKGFKKGDPYINSRYN